MIDPTLRLEHLARVAADPTPGCSCSTSCSATAPSPTRPRCSPRRSPPSRQPVVIAVVGTDADPQGLDRQVDALVDAGAEVHLSNAGATRRALELLARPARAPMTTPTHVVTVGADLLADAVAEQAVGGHPGRLAPADDRHRGRPRDRRRRPAAP